MNIKLIGGPKAGETVTVQLDERMEPPETILVAPSPGADGVPYRVHRCNDPFAETWWWAYVVYSLYPQDLTQGQIEASRP